MIKEEILSITLRAGWQKKNMSPDGHTRLRILNCICHGVGAKNKYVNKNLKKKEESLKQALGYSQIISYTWKRAC